MTGDSAAPAALFAFVQVEVPWPLGPPDGRYVLRDSDGSPVTHVVVLATLGAPERRRGRGRRRREAPLEPDPTPVSTGRATVVTVAPPLDGPDAARAWLHDAGEDELDAGLAVVNRALHAVRLVATDPHVHAIARDRLIAARVGYGAGEQVADGRWTQAVKLGAPPVGRRRRRTALAPQARLAAVLGARERPLICEELVLRARLDLEEGRSREAALQVLVALDAALAELGADPHAPMLADRLAELRGRREAVAQAAQAALSATPPAGDRETVESTVERIEAALRARAAIGSSA